MPAPLSRSDLESFLYMDLHPCECGATGSEPERTLHIDGDRMLVEYTGDCGTCGRPRHFAFTMSTTVPALDTGAWSTLREPSQLLDPGEWLRVADFYAARHLGPAADTEPGVEELDAEAARDRAVDLALAAGAVEEALLFLPAGADAAPRAAFRSELGREVRDADPGRLTRAALELSRDVYRAASGEVQPDGTAGPLPARSVVEASLYADLHRCPCGLDRFERTSEWRRAGPGEARATLVYDGTCELCGRSRRFTFTVPDRPAGEPTGPMGYGYADAGDGASVLLDPGQYRVVALRLADDGDELAAAAVPEETWRDEDFWEGALDIYASAVAAVDEVLAFIPDGADRVPATAFRTATGRALHGSDPDLFLRENLLAARAERVRRLEGFLAAHPEPEPDDDDDDEGE